MAKVNENAIGKGHMKLPTAAVIDAIRKTIVEKTIENIEAEMFQDRIVEDIGKDTAVLVHSAATMEKNDLGLDQ